MEVVEDEKKPFDSITAQEDDVQPDPEEHLMLDQGSGKAWLVKIPKSLMERWASVNVEDVHLATIRIYPAEASSISKKPRIVLFLPPNRDPINTPPPLTQNTSQNTSQPLSRSATPTPAAGTPPQQQRPPPGPSLTHPHILNWPFFDPAATLPTTGSEPDVYELEMVNDNVENQIVVAERPKEGAVPTSSHAPSSSGYTSFGHSYASSAAAAAAAQAGRARTTILTGRIKHEANLRPAFSSTYRKQMRERHAKYNTPTRQIRMIEDAGVSGGRGGINRLSSGVGLGAGGRFAELVRTKPKQAKGTFERMARMPRNQLLDQLFSLFRDQPRWSIKPLRERTQQPEAYLKEVLSEIAFLHRSGEHNGFWELKPNFKEDSEMKAENVPVQSGFSGDVKAENDDDDDDSSDDSDDDMEEVS